jgi:diphosphomevalonate decarboxylase
MNKKEFIQKLLSEQPSTPQKSVGQAFAPSNIALIKYWGKRQHELNLPMTSSLSISLGNKGAQTDIRVIDRSHDRLIFNKQEISTENKFYQRTQAFLDLLRPNAQTHYEINTTMNIPLAAGLASSACGIAALVQAYADLYQWNLPLTLRSIICRIGSGSACRSLWQGFVEWHRGEFEDGIDSYAQPLPYTLPTLALGLLIIDDQEKSLSSRTAMSITTDTAILYEAWPKQVAHDLQLMKHALEQQDFDLVGKTAEHNALAMHATMLASMPSICYSTPATLSAIKKIWQLRQDGLAVYFTQDAGPNLKLLFETKNSSILKQYFPELEVINYHEQ